MDPCAAIPEDLGEEVRKRHRDRDEEERKAPNKRRRIPSTSISNAEIPASLQPPKPEENLDAYDPQRLEQGLEYITSAFKRDITPRTRTFLELHQEAYEKALVEPSENPAAVAVVQALDQVYDTQPFYFKPRQGKDYEEFLAFVKLRQFEMLANYGDCLGQELQELRAELKQTARFGGKDVKEAAFALGPPTTWVQIADELSGNSLGIDTHVRVACGVLGIEADHVTWLIKDWGTRCRDLHNSVRENIKDCRWTSLKDLLCRDLKELLMVTDGKTASKYQTVLLSLAHEYFEIDDYVDSDAWYPNDKARELMKQKKRSSQ